MIVTISGTPGAGKTAIAKRVAAEIGFSFSSIADLRQRLSRENELSEAENENHELWTDDQIDEYLEEIGASYDNLIIASRFAFHLVPHSFKVLLTCDPLVAARRLVRRRDERYGEELGEIEAAITERIEKDRARGTRFYGKDPHDPKHFDLVLDLSRLDEDEAVGLLTAGLGSLSGIWKNSGPEHI